MVRAPRALITGFDRGMALGEPGDEASHRSVLDDAVQLLRKDATVEVIR